MVCPMLISFKP